MAIEPTLDWTTAEPYLRAVALRLRWLQFVTSLDRRYWAAREAREQRRLQAATRFMPNYLRRDIGLPPG